MNNLGEPCPGMETSLSNFMDGSLSNEERELTEAHVINCPACRAWLSEVSTLTGRLRKEFEGIHASADLEQGIWEMMERVRSEEQVARLLWLGLGTSTALFLLVLAGFMSPVGVVLTSLFRLTVQIGGYAWVLVSHLLRFQFAIIASLATVGIGMVGVGGLTLQRMTRTKTPSFGRIRI